MGESVGEQKGEGRTGYRRRKESLNKGSVYYAYKRINVNITNIGAMLPSSAKAPT